MRKKLTGKVIGAGNEKTRIVEVGRSYLHGALGKVVKIKGKLHCHDENNASSVGDTVVIVESRPRSKLKRWTVVKVNPVKEGPARPDAGGAQ